MDMRILGLAGFVERQPLIRLMREIAIAAFSLAVLTGIALFSIRAQQYATNPAFQVKMMLIVVAGLNFWAFSHLTGKTGEHEAYSPAARLLAGLSVFIWVGVLVAGRFIGFI
ncbi:hypothetical protein [Aquamicrobium sp. LC103]|uniref:hypothetical protein n=1 Tax=Aquamicrobium sp. LC103 TaxID=1120658 RepID=UPI001FEF47FE|nr:hypothetical protein [Aquamicrobium sp. LC103]